MKNDVKNKRVKIKEMLCAALLFTALLLSLYGCGKKEQEQKTDPRVITVGSARMKPESDQKPDMEQGENNKITFPENFSETIGNVTFDMDIIINTDLTESPVVTAKAQMQKVNQEKAFQLFFSDIAAYDTYDYEEADEYGKMTQSVTCVSPEETTLSYGPQSSTLEYMERDLMPAVLNTFVPFEDERYNADLYSRTEQLSFMTREEAFETVQKALQEVGINMEMDYTGYALDYKTMQSQEYYEDMDGHIDKSQYKPQWSDTDDCYYFYMNQIYRGLPLYHVYNQVFGDAGDINAPIQAVVSREGIEWLKIEKVFALSQEQDCASLADMDAVIKAAADKYNQMPGDDAYEVTKAELYYYVDLSSGLGTYDVKPAWILSGYQKGGKKMQIVIDAQTAEEII